MEFVFGSGSVWGYPLTTIAGVAVTTPTPLKFGILQDVSVDFDFTLKELYGTYQFPVALGRGKAKLMCKAKFAQINTALYNNVLFGQAAPSTTLTSIAEDEAGTIGASPYQITVSNSATWTIDLGVRYAATGLPLTRVPSGVTTGTYSVAAGVYTFAAADTTLGVLISYIYTTATSGKGLVIANQLLGNVPTFRASLKAQFSGKQIMMDLYSCVANKLNLASKLDDFMIPEMDFQAFADSANNIGLISTVE